MRSTITGWGLSVAIGCMIVSGCEKTSKEPADQVAEQAVATNAEVLELNDMNFTAQIADGVVLVDFWAPWCGPCRTQGPIVEQTAKLVGGTAKVAKVNVDQASKTAQQFGVQSIPTLIVFKDGKPGKRFVGVTQSDALVAAIQEAL